MMTGRQTMKNTSVCMAAAQQRSAGGSRSFSRLQTRGPVQWLGASPGKETFYEQVMICCRGV